MTTFKKAIDDRRVLTWSYDKNGDLTHSADQWKNLAWFRPVVQADRITLYIMAPKNGKISKKVYAIYHGRVIESMLAHCDQLFTSGSATALAHAGDSVG